MLTIWLATGVVGKGAQVDLAPVGIETNAASLGVPELTVSGLAPIETVPGLVPVAGARRRRVRFKHQLPIPIPVLPVHLQATPLSTAAPFLGRPGITQTNNLTAESLTGSAASIGTPQVTRTFARLDNAFWYLAA
jgi:hypothetical protein